MAARVRRPRATSPERGAGHDCRENERDPQEDAEDAFAVEIVSSENMGRRQPHQEREHRGEERLARAGQYDTPQPRVLGRQRQDARSLRQHGRETEDKDPREGTGGRGTERGVGDAALEQRPRPALGRTTRVHSLIQESRFGL
jgi:hypothetical protein